MNTGSIVWTVVLSVLNDVLTFEKILQTIAHLAYLIMSWVLSIIDFLFILVRQLAGLNTDFSSLQAVQESDVIFQFIFNETVVSIMRNLVLLAVVVILVLGIIAIIKNEYNAVRDESNSGEIKNDKKGIWKNIFQSILLLFLIPMILFGGLILSSGLLQTIDNYTRGHTGNHSVGSKIFVASSYDANNFRHYAQQDKKIPITYQFSQVQDYSAVTDWDTTGRAEKISQGLATLKQQPEWMQGLTTFTMFYTNLFYSMDNIDYLEINDTEHNAYHDMYDANIRTYKYEYYANADAIDYMIETGRTLHYYTAEEVLYYANMAGVEFNLTVDGGAIKFTVNYEDGQSPLTYSHPVSSTPVTDESQGAVYLLCLEKQAKDDAGTVHTYYQPLTNGQDEFVSYALDKGQYVVARGLFDDAKYPTAIKQVDGGNVQFYREKLNVPTFASFFPHISYELPDGVTEEPSTHLIRKAIEFFTGVDLADFMPYIYFDLDFLHLFGKSTDRVWTLNGHSFLQDYTFKSTTHGVFTEIFVLENKQMELTYYNLRINWIVLILASIILLGKLLKAFIGLLRRLVDIMVLYVMYPAAVATIPLYGNSSLGNWTKRMFTKVTAMYGFVIGINLGFILLTPISGLNLITTEMLQSNSAFAWMVNLFGVNGMGAKVVNSIIQILFYLVGIWFIFEIPKIVQTFVQNEALPDLDNPKGGKSVEDIVTSGGEVIKGTTEYFTKVADVISGKKLLKDIENIKKFAPGGAIIQDLKKKKQQREMARLLGTNKEDAQALTEALKAGATAYAAGEAGGAAGGNNGPKPGGGGSGGGPSGPGGNGNPPASEGGDVSQSGGHGGPSAGPNNDADNSVEAAKEKGQKQAEQESKEMEKQADQEQKDFENSSGEEFSTGGESGEGEKANPLGVMKAAKELDEAQKQNESKGLREGQNPTEMNNDSEEQSGLVGKVNHLKAMKGTKNSASDDDQASAVESNNVPDDQADGAADNNHDADENAEAPKPQNSNGDSVGSGDNKAEENSSSSTKEPLQPLDAAYYSQYHYKQFLNGREDTNELREEFKHYRAVDHVRAMTGMDLNSPAGQQLYDKVKEKLEKYDAEMQSLMSSGFSREEMDAAYNKPGNSESLSPAALRALREGNIEAAVAAEIVAEHSDKAEPYNKAWRESEEYKNMVAENGYAPVQTRETAAAGAHDLMKSYGINDGQEDSNLPKKEDLNEGTPEKTDSTEDTDTNDGTTGNADGEKKTGETSKTCGNCGAKNGPNDKFCSNCGKPL